jgi:hypothetical protein
VAYQGGRFRGSTPTPNFKVLTKLSLFSNFCGKYTHNNLIRIRVSLICIFSGTLTEGYRPQISVFSVLCPQLDLLNTLWGLTWGKMVFVFFYDICNVIIFAMLWYLQCYDICNVIFAILWYLQCYDICNVMIFVKVMIFAILWYLKCYICKFMIFAMLLYLQCYDICNVMIFVMLLYL